MAVLKLRTKIEALIALLMIVVLATITAVSVTRTITNTGDNVETFIRNSNGNYWSVSEVNLQAAINDLGDGTSYSGIVWMPGNKTLQINTGIVLKKYVTLNMQGSMLDVRSDVNGVTMAEGSVLEDGVIQTGNMGTYSHAAIMFDGSKQYMTGNTNVERMNLRGLQSSSTKGVAIQYQCDTQGDKIAFTSCDNIWIYGFKYGILINVSGGAAGPTTYANNNMFNNIHFIGPIFAIYLNRDDAVPHGQCDCDANQFNNIQMETDTVTQRMVFADGRYNIFDNILVWDWVPADHSQYAFEFSTDSQYNFLTYQCDYSSGVQSDCRYISNGTGNYRQDIRNGEYSMKIFSQATEPDIPNNTMAYWYNTSTGKYYIIQDFGGTQKKGELT